MSELAADNIPVAVSLRVLKLSRQPYYRWRKQQVTNAELIEAYRANALLDAHVDDPEYGYRLLVDEAADAGEKMCERTAWKICQDNQWWSVFGKKPGKNGAMCSKEGSRARAGLTIRRQPMPPQVCELTLASDHRIHYLRRWCRGEHAGRASCCRS